MVDPDENLDQKIPVWRLTNKTSWAPLHYGHVLSHILIGSAIPFGNTVEKLPFLFSPYYNERSQAAISMIWFLVLHALPLFFLPKKRAFLKILFSVQVASLGTLLGFHVSHLAPELEATYERGVDWGAFQLATTTNFDASSWYSVSGTLDLQNEHHLFPMLSYENQQSIIPIVKQTAEEFGVPYNCYSSSVTGIFHHLSYMASLGQKPVPNEEL